MYDPSVAAQLRAGGHDASCSQDSNLKGIRDDEVIAAALGSGRVVVTENVRDFRILEARVVAGGLHHAGIVYTSNRQFPRGAPATVGLLVRALEVLLAGNADLRDRSIFLARPPG